MGKLRVVVSHDPLEPLPIRRAFARKRSEQLAGKHIPHLADRAVPGKARRYSWIARSAKAHARGELNRATTGKPALEQAARRDCDGPHFASGPAPCPLPKAPAHGCPPSPCFQPLPLMAHEIAEPAGIRVEGIPEEREVSAREPFQFFIRMRQSSSSK